MKNINWPNFFTNNWFTHPQQLMPIIIVIIILAGIITIGLLVYQYVDYTDVKVTIEDNQFWYQETQNKGYLKNQHHWEHRLQKSMFTEDTSIMNFIIIALRYWIKYSAIGLLICVCISIISYSIRQISIHIVPIFTITQWALLFTIIGLLIPIGLGYHRNKPQWLKLLLAIIEIVLLIALILELTNLYL